MTRWRQRDNYERRGLDLFVRGEEFGGRAETRGRCVRVAARRGRWKGRLIAVCASADNRWNLFVCGWQSEAARRSRRGRLSG